MECTQVIGGLCIEHDATSTLNFWKPNRRRVYGLSNRPFGSEIKITAHHRAQQCSALCLVSSTPPNI
jgi:hypothetical protein